MRTSHLLACTGSGDLLKREAKPQHVPRRHTFTPCCQFQVREKEKRKTTHCTHGRTERSIKLSIARAGLQAQSAHSRPLQSQTIRTCCVVVLSQSNYFFFSQHTSLSLSHSNLNPSAPFKTKISGTPQLLRLGRKTRSKKKQKKKRRIIDGLVVVVRAPSLIPECRRRCRLSSRASGWCAKKPGGPPESVRYLRVRRLHTIWSRRSRWLYRRLSYWTMAPSVRFQKIPACQFISCCVHGARTLLHTLKSKQRLYFPP